MWSVSPSPLKTGKLDGVRKVLLIIFYGKKTLGIVTITLASTQIFLKVDETRSGYGTGDKERRF
jgi:hypothetical protein